MIDLSVDLIMANNILWQSELEKFTSAGTILTNFSEAYALLTALPFNGQIGYAFRNKDFIFKNIYLTSCKQHNKVGSLYKENEFAKFFHDTLFSIEKHSFVTLRTIILFYSYGNNSLRKHYVYT